MKHTALLLPLLLMSASGFGHIDQAKKVAIKSAPGTDIIVCPADTQSCQGFRKNPDKNPLIAEINKLELDYLNLKSLEIQNSFAAKPRAKIESQGGVFQAYLKHLGSGRTPGVYVEEIVKFPPVKQHSKPGPTSSPATMAMAKKHSPSLNQANTQPRINGLSAILERDPASAAIPNNQHNPLITQINQRERLNFNEIIRDAQKSFEYDFFRIEGHQGIRKKPTDDTFKAYIKYLHKITGQ